LQEHALETEIDVSQPLGAGGPVLTDLIVRWGALPSSLTHVRDGANSIYRFQSGQSWHFLRLTNDRHRSRCQVDAELDFIRFVVERGVPAVVPVTSDRGAYAETVEDSEGNTWHAVVFAAAPGRQFRFFSPDIAKPLFRTWGSVMGTLHAASSAFVPGASRRRPSWTYLDSTCCDHSKLPASETAALREHERISRWLTSLGTTPDCWGMIHGDLERTNFTWDGHALCVYDFDDACYHWYLADVAHALWAFRRAPADDRAMFLRWFLAGYGESRHIVADVREHLSWFVRLRSLSLFIQRLARGGVTDRDWVRRLRAGFDPTFTW
jgi:Ser/Thr protein kinase RdoA (MazF antagonist)